MAVTSPHEDLPRWPRWQDAALWSAILTGPIATLAVIAVNEAYVEHAERHSSRLVLVVVIAAAALATLLAAGLAWLGARRGDGVFRPDAQPAEREERVRFMLHVGLTVTAFSLLAIGAMLVPALLLRGGDLP